MSTSEMRNRRVWDLLIFGSKFKYQYNIIRFHKETIVIVGQNNLLATRQFGLIDSCLFRKQKNTTLLYKQIRKN